MKQLVILAVFAFGLTQGRPEAKIPGYLDNSTSNDLGTWEAPEDIKRNFPFEMIGFDNEHRRVYYLKYGKWDMRTYVEKGGQDFENLDKFVQQILHKILNDGKKYALPDDKHANEVSLICDYDEFSFIQLASAPTLQYFLASVGKFQTIANAVEYGFFINVNAVAETFLNLAKPILGSFMERMEIYGPKKGRWVPRLLRKIPEDQLPQSLGGNGKYKPVPQL